MLNINIKYKSKCETYISILNININVKPKYSSLNVTHIANWQNIPGPREVDINTPTATMQAS